MRAALCLYRQPNKLLLRNRVRVAFGARHSSQHSSASPINSSIASGMDREEWHQTLASRPAIVFYHYPCTDGVFAALAAAMFFEQRGTQARFHPHEVYRETDLQGIQPQADEVAYLLDYSGPDGFPQNLAQHVSHVFVLDHHKTAAAALADTSSHPANLHVHMDMQRSGATIARDWFQPAGLSSELQEVYQWVQDADLWTWKLPHSKAFHAGLSNQSLEFNWQKNPSIWQQLQQLDVQNVLADGREVLLRQERLVSQAVAESKPFQLGGAKGLTRGWGTCLGVRVQGEVTKFRSELGNRLALRSKELGLKPVGLVAYVEVEMPNRDTTIKVSLRSTDGFDTSQMSQAFGGGGHAAASSCIVTREELDSWQQMAPAVGAAEQQQLGAQLASVIHNHVSQ